MSGDNGNGGSSHERRGSVTSAAFSNLFHRSNSTSAGNGRESAAALAAREQRRRLSVTTLGLSGTSPPSQTNTPFGLRRGSISTNNSEAIDESAVEDDDYAAKPAPSSPFARRISFGAQAMRNIRTGPVSPGSVDNGYNWSEQLRSRAESSLTNHRPSFGAAASVSPSRLNGQHDRAKSVSDMPPPPQQAAAMKPRHVERPKPDHMQERILKGDFYMD